MRVLGLAMQRLEKPDEPLEQDLVFIGLVGMIDPPRPEVKTARATAKTAGIRPIMITGDHPLTARFIAHDLGISENGRVKTGQNIDQMTPEELAEAVRDVSIFARVSPEHKLRIVEALQNQGENRSHDWRWRERFPRPAQSRLSVWPWASPARMCPKKRRKWCCSTTISPPSSPP
ncbi:MAG: HAD family hydrolase [Chloroflexi bacterium]|nr:HAD family hydrolase [Chloroflexota bacterium]